jgi:hypothetical protein
MTVLSLVRRGRRRLLGNEALTQAAYALSVALALVVVLLILGAEVLAWQWLVAMPLFALGVGMFRLIRRMPNEYVIAQRIDANLKLSDTLSTAFYYINPARQPVGSDSMRASQREVAEQVAGHVSLEQAMPFRMPRAMYAVALFGVVASALFGLRYGFTRSLDLRPPLAQVIQDAMGWEWMAQRAAVQRPRPKPKPPEAEEMFGMDLPDTDRNPGELDPAGEEALETVGVPETDPEKYGGEQTKGPRNAQMEGDEGEQGDSSEETEASAGSEGAGDGDQSDAQAKQPKEGKPSPGNRGGENSSLMAKLKEAMQNLLSRMKQENQSASQQDSSQDGKQQAKQQGKGGQKGGKQGSQQQGQGQESEGSDDGQAGDEAQMAQNPQGKGSGQSADESDSKQPGSGIGKQDGDKEAKLAEQLEAMGKISQIIGKRSANVSGEITIEVQNTNQQLKTPYSTSGARHSEAAGEIARDEVPVIYQTFVQQYFEQVRKQQPALQDAPKPASTTAGEPTATAKEPASAPVDAARQPLPTSRPAGR